MDSPKVFGNEDVTVVLGPGSWPNSLKLYVGQDRIKLMSQVIVNFLYGKSTLEVVFPLDTEDKEQNLAIEQEIRSLSGFKWLTIRREE